MHFRHAGVVLEDWLDQLWAADHEVAGVAPVWLQLDARDVLDKDGELRRDKLLRVYLRSLVAAACGVEVQGVLIGRDTALHVQPMAQDVAQQALPDLLELWLQGQQSPLPVPMKTGMAMAWQDEAAARTAYEGGFVGNGEAEDMYWQRLYPDFQMLNADGRLHDLALAIYGPMEVWLQQCVENVGWIHHTEQGGHA